MICVEMGNWYFEAQQMSVMRSQNQSADWAMKYEGWTINPIMEDWRDSYVWYAE